MNSEDGTDLDILADGSVNDGKLVGAQRTPHVMPHHGVVEHKPGLRLRPCGWSGVRRGLQAAAAWP